MLTLFVKNDLQKQWINTLLEREDSFREKSVEVDRVSSFPKENFEELIRLGYNYTTLPKEYGGEGFKVYDMLLLQETLARFDSNTALSIGWNQGVVGELYEKKLWDEHQLSLFAQALHQGAIVNRAVSEAQTGSPTRGGKPGTNAVKQGGQWIVNGRKIFTTASPMLTHFLVGAWIEDKGQMGYFLIPRDVEGLSIEETWDVMSMRGTGSHDLMLENVRVADSSLVEIPNKAAHTTLNGWLLHIPACYIGIAQAARDYAVQFASEYSPNSLKGTIGELPHIQQHIGEMDLELMRARHFMYSVAEMYDDETKRQHLTNELSAVKHAVTNAAIRVVDKAMRVAGAKSLQSSCPLQQHYRDVRAGLHNPPMDDMTISKLAATALEQQTRK